MLGWEVPGCPTPALGVLLHLIYFMEGGLVYNWGLQGGQLPSTPHPTQHSSEALRVVLAGL